jgi:glycosyltransferase involved in cell wall biosynthesis
LSNKVVIVVTPSTENINVNWDAGLASRLSRLITFTLKEEKNLTLEPEFSKLLDYIHVDSIDEYYTVLNRAIFPFIDSGVPVLFVSPDQIFDVSDIDELVSSISIDPYYGFALPRTNVGGSATVPLTKGDAVIADPEKYREFFSILPPRGRHGVVQGLPVLVDHQILLNFGRLEGAMFDLSDALAMLYIRANRRGYSAVISNRALFYTPVHEMHTDDLDALPKLKHASDYYKALKQQAELPEILLEKLLWYRFKPKSRKKVLFDIRNLDAFFNGTAEHILSLILPIIKNSGNYSIDPLFLVSPEAAEFHRLDKLIPGMYLSELTEDDIFDATIKLSQPWGFGELRDHAYHSCINVYLMLDTIAWDCSYIRMSNLDGVWRTVSEYADGFLYNSAYTKKLFNRRFPKSTDVPSDIAYCSLDLKEYCKTGNELVPDDENAEKYILVVGNHYFHKGLNKAVKSISAAFPEVRIKVLGDISGSYPNVEVQPSGMLAQEVVDRLFSQSTCMVFPSFYEGFGLPVLKALSYGVPTIVRSSELIDEIKGKLHSVDLMTTFDRDAELFRAINTVMKKGRSAAPDASKLMDMDTPFGWGQSAQVILELLQKLLVNTDTDRCIKRLDFFYKVQQINMEREDILNENIKIVIETEQDR